MILDDLRELTLSGNHAERHALLWREADAIRQYLHGFRLDDADNAFIEAYVNDALARFFLTLDRMPFERGLRVLEIGGNPYLFSLLLRKLHDYELTCTNFFAHDIFKPANGGGTQRLFNGSESHSFDYQNLNMEVEAGPYLGGGFDVIVFAEVLEHLIIDPLCVFPKLYDSLAPGGTLVLTTPNATRLVNVANMLAGSNIFDRYHPANGIYGRHNREFTVEEVERLLSQHGFEIEHVVTEDRYNYDVIPIAKDNYEAPAVLPLSNRSAVIAAMEAAGANLAHRGDNIYAVARRPR